MTDDKKIFLVKANRDDIEYLGLVRKDSDFKELNEALEEKIRKEVQTDWKELLKTHHVCRQEDSVPTIIRMTIQKLKDEIGDSK